MPRPCQLACCDAGMCAPFEEFSTRFCPVDHVRSQMMVTATVMVPR